VGRVKGAFACVVDRAHRFHCEAVRWFVSLVYLARVDPGDLVVHVIGERSHALEVLQRHGARIVDIETFDARVPPCNKIAGALALSWGTSRPDEVVVLCDTDVAIVEDVRQLPVPRGAIGCKVVDGPNPPLRLLEVVFARAGISRPRVVATDCEGAFETLEGNANGGLYVLRAELLPRIAEAWAFWARWLVEAEVLTGFLFFVDQVAMALALHSEGIAQWPLQRRWNYPVHVAQWTESCTTRPAVIHYHRSVDSDGRIKASGSPTIDSVIRAVNEAMTDFLEAERSAGLPEWMWPQSRGAVGIAKPV
jgi:hypothetical protein